MADAEKQKLQFGINEHAWQREYMLNIIPPDDQVVRPEWIEYYDHMPATHAETDFQYVQIGVDLAISEEDKADYTAMVPIMVYGDGEDVRLYVLPNIVNERLTSEKQFQAAMDFDITDGERHLNQYFLVEDVGYQKAFIQRLVAAGIEAEGITPKSRDKRERLTVAASLLEQGRVLFPRNGAKVLIDQLINFGTERYDDLADAFAYVLLDVIKTCMNGTVSVSMLEVENFNDRTYNENPFTNDKYRIAPRGEQGRLRAKFPGEFV
jgi:predicted phage terminase large subunit-like protein